MFPACTGAKDNREPDLRDVLVVYLSVLVYILGAGSLFGRMDRPWLGLLYPAGFGLIPVLYSLLRGKGLSWILPSPPSGKSVHAGHLCGGILLMTGTCISVIVASVVLGPYIPAGRGTGPALQNQVNAASWIYSLLAIAVFPAIFEEILCRGFILSGLRNNLSGIRPVVLTSLLFAFLHQDPLRMAFAFTAGLALSWAGWRTGSLLLPVIMHFIYNLFLWLAVRCGIIGMLSAASRSIPGGMASVGVTAVAASLVLVFWGLMLFRPETE